MYYNVIDLYLGDRRSEHTVLLYNRASYTFAWNLSKVLSEFWRYNQRAK